MHLSINARICKIIFLFLLVVHTLPVYTRAESVHLITVPKKVSSSQWTWSWTATGPTGGGVEQWKNAWPNDDRTKPVRYSVCDALSHTPKANQWLTSTHIFISPANRIDITIEYAMSDCSVINNQYCRQNFSLYLHKSRTQLSIGSLPDPYKNLDIFEKIGTSSPKVLSTAGNLDQAQRNKETFSVMVDAAKPYVYLAFHYQGGCVKLFSVTVQYYKCPSIKLSSNLVKLPQTIAPADNSTKVKGSCSSAQHLKPLTNESDLYGYCQEDGEWSTDRYRGECGCDYGYGKVATVSAGSECRECPLGTYSDKVSNSKCTTCPLNSEQDSSRTSCDCKPNFYRTDEQTEFDSCAGQPSAPQNLSITFLNASFVTVTWFPPTDNGGRSDLYYTAECKQCNDQGTECTQECTGSNITVNQNSRLASINSLSAYTYYQLKVYAKNEVSKLAEEKNDLAKFAEDLIRTKESVPGIPVVTLKQLSSTSVFLSWEVEEKNGVITYYQVSYYPVDQPSNVKKFNTTSTNTTITGLETGKEYQFQVQASSRLGLGKAAAQTKKVAKLTEGKPFFSRSIVQGVIAGVVGALILILIFAIICVCRKRRRRRSISRELLAMNPNFILVDGHKMYVDPSNYGSPMEALMCTAEEIEREKIELEKSIGGGEFADVYKGTLKNDSGREIVAVKILKPKPSVKNREDFIREASIMGQFKHPNVIALKGVVTRSSDTPMMIVTEYMANGSLDHFLMGHEGQLTVLQLLGMIRGVADGMAYLSGMNFIHRDLAARNILVADNMASKVADFGLSRELDDAEDNPNSVYQTQGGKIPVRWTAPEAIRYRKFSWASDVWSFGILMWEIMSFSERPYWEWDNFQVMDRVDSGYRLPAPMNCPKAIHNLMLDCWEGDKDKRPKFADILKRTEEMIRSPDKLKDDLCTSRFSADPSAKTNFGEVTSVEEWLDTLNMQQYVNNFKEAGLSQLDQVKTMSEEDLAKIGVKLIGHRNKMKKSIKAMKKHFDEQNDAEC
ncbi:ephrin type-B receptor 1-B-like isoform X2 [Actinia tenebrosa]|uniref:receptor protein-tyrosine kinase n=1 Tax=Actinia tenebrosa TaxID=6105 RepID=A0A6P8J6Q5_ACTTE|nr:ephrin type-B receptor 1-B-like isoform X2 [Actinia tenebrosa]